MHVCRQKKRATTGRSLSYLVLWIYAFRASARRSRLARLSAFSVERMVTMGSTTFMHFICPTRSHITRAAAGAHDPFSMIPTVRRCQFLLLSRQRKISIAGSMPASYVDDASTVVS